MVLFSDGQAYMKGCLFMKKIISTLVATMMIATSLISTAASAANGTEPYFTGISTNGDSSPRSYINFTLADNGEHYLESYRGPKTVSVYANFTSTVKISYYFNGDYRGNFTFSSGSPSHSLTIPANTNCAFYVQAYYASSSNPVRGYVNIT